MRKPEYVPTSVLTHVVNLQALEALLKTYETMDVLVSTIGVNNETGLVNPITEIGTLCHKYGKYFHVDATQMLTKLPIDVQGMNIDYLSASGHKFGAPKGIGLLYVRNGCPVHNLMYGGHQEDGLRPGTENVPYIVGLGYAVNMLTETASMKAREAYEESLKILLWRQLKASPFGDKVTMVGTFDTTIGSILSITIEGYDANKLVSMMSMRDFCISAGSACKQGSATPSAVLKAYGLTDQQAASTIRISFGCYNTKEEVLQFVQALSECIKFYNILGGENT